MLGTISLFAHIIAGTVTLVAGPLAIFYNFKDPRKHRMAGKIFFYAMLAVCVTAVGGFLKRPEQVFFQFLLGISVLVFANVMRGVRAIQLMKGGQVRPLDFGYSGLLLLTGAAMLAYSAWLWMNDKPLIFIVLLAVFGVSSTTDGFQNLRLFRRGLAGEVDKMTWYRLHVASMVGAFMASTTAFTVNALPMLPWPIQWFGPTLALLPVQIYFGRKLRSREAAPVA